MFDACRWLEGYMSVRQAAVPLDSGSRTLLYRDTDEKSWHRQILLARECNVVKGARLERRAATGGIETRQRAFHASRRTTPETLKSLQLTLSLPAVHGALPCATCCPCPIGSSRLVLGDPGTLAELVACAEKWRDAVPSWGFTTLSAPAIRTMYSPALLSSIEPMKAVI